MTNSVNRKRSSKGFLEEQSRPNPMELKNRLKMVSGAFYIPKNNESKPLGEDAHFICSQNHTIGVADGVGSWANKGIDAGIYARELMSNAALSISSNYREGQNVDPKRVLNQAFLNSKAQGSSTALIVTLRNGCFGNFLHAANVGDSGFLLIRGGNIVFESPKQQSRFNCPYQLGNSCTRSPSSAMELVVPVVAGDIVVAATDGLFDNVYGHEIETVVKLATEETDMAEVVAWAVAQYALDRAEDDTYFSPFERAAEEAGFHHVGGKYDDITVVVSYIEAAERANPQIS